MPTDAEIELRAELEMGFNPLLERAAPFIKFGDLPQRLKSSPLEGKNWKSIPPEAREPLLEYASQQIVPTSTMLEPSAGLQRLFRRGLSLQNPVKLEQRLRTARIATLRVPAQMSGLPSLGGAGGLWASPTGMGKSMLAKRVLEVICPDQVIEHDPCREAGWQHLTQCCYLYIDHPSNGTRGGLLKRILLALDQALFTDYSEQYERVTNIDTLLVTVSKLMIAHRVALLVIDENQSRNFLESPWQIEFVLFYLGLMNLGISVLLLGNSVAFDHLKSFSQVMRRFSVGGVFDFFPAKDADPWWCDEFVPGMRKFSLVEKCSIEENSRTRRENEACAGFPGLFEAFQTEAQRSALRRGGHEAILTSQDFDEALVSPRYLALAEVARSVREKSGEFADLSSTESEQSSTLNSDIGRFSRSNANVISSLLGRYKAEQTRLTNSFTRKMRALEALSPEDLRMLGASDAMLAQLIEGSPFVKGVKKPKRAKS
ncbi:TniB family NTP-binding protein [Acidovorax sp.]|uniref:TniB family NTP-binding protein n=1 Tax=Acidovorax sp. TaxID=1872122 RepID=UPI0025C09CB3|nr:TniB family NTP-binding protein [Acidovorax sp.]